MASQEEIQDAILAKRLQDEEYQNLRSVTERQDAELARRISEQQQQSEQTQRFALQPGQTIGEVLLVHFVNANTMAFELAANKGRYLRATSSGTVEFTASSDDKTKFLIESTGQGTLYLRNKNYNSKTNSRGSVGWYLSMSPEGVLSSNGAKNEYAQWALISAATTPAALPPPNPTPLAAPGVAYTHHEPPVPAPPAQQAAVHQHLTSRDTMSGDMEMQSFHATTATNTGAVADTSNPMMSRLRVPGAGAGAVSRSNSISTPATAAQPSIPPQYAQSPQQDHHQQMLARSLSSGAPISSASSSVLLFPGHDAGRDALMRFFTTPGGVQFLQQPAYHAAYILYSAGVLGKILHRPDWPVVAARFQDYAKSPHPALNAPAADAALSFRDKKQFFEEGFTVARGVVPVEAVERALRLTHFWTARHMNETKPQSSTTAVTGSYNENLRRHKITVELTGAVTSDCDLLALYYCSALAHIASQLIGDGDVANPTTARVCAAYPSFDLPADFGTAGAGSVLGSDRLGGDQWSIEGFDSTGGHSPYNLLVGVALTDMLLPSQGNLAVHAGSHLLLMEAYKHAVASRSGLFSEDPALVKKPDLGEPTQLLLRAGDAVLCTQRLARLHAPNLNSCTPQVMAFFRLSSVDHEVLKGPALDGLWLEFRGADKYSASEEAPQSAAAGHGNKGNPSSAFYDDFLSLSSPPPSSSSSSTQPPVSIAVSTQQAVPVGADYFGDLLFMDDLQQQLPSASSSSSSAAVVGRHNITVVGQADGAAAVVMVTSPVSLGVPSATECLSPQQDQHLGSSIGSPVTGTALSPSDQGDEHAGQATATYPPAVAIATYPTL